MTEKNTPMQNWERETLEKVLFATVNEQKRNRRWKIFFRFIYLILFITIVAVIFGMSSESSKDYYTQNKPHVGVVDVKGEIAEDGRANASNINEALDEAFEDKKTVAVMLYIDSPGGSPVQAGEVYQHLHYLEKQNPKTKVYAVCTDMCASGAYYIAAGANYIYADKASLVGSIGVLMNGFGFVDTLQKLGISRRLLTAGSEKGFLDPFSPMKPQDQAYMQNMLNVIHQQFINAVQTGRGTRLKNDPLLFSGLVWTGQQALPLGLIDGIATPEQVARDIIKNENLVNYSIEPSPFEKFAKNIGTSAASSAASELGIRQGMLQ
ncbi:MAG: S49 family peptidase [Legionellales bacterium]|nr:S49 family peptidase [Legionellales bacterium]|tara:strand:- start:70 stop:1035 length:966 start_codon:yes stop_codon:yes gene_type:complete